MKCAAIIPFCGGSTLKLYRRLPWTSLATRR
jgi:hypothetical protein